MPPHDPILEGLEQLRKRLLDLSKRNKLLNSSIVASHVFES